MAIMDNIRDDILASAISFLHDASVATASADSRVAFLKSKGLSTSEISRAFLEAGLELPPSMHNVNESYPRMPAGSATSMSTSYHNRALARDQLTMRAQRDWRDWFIMATVVGGAGYGIYTAVKRYIVPMIAPPTTPQLEQDKRAIDESFERAFALLEQVTKDTADLKAAERARTERLDTALGGVEGIVSELKDASRRREDDYRRVNEEVRGLKGLIPKAMESHKASTDGRLGELQAEMSSLKQLLGQRLGSTSNELGYNPGTQPRNGSHTMNAEVRNRVSESHLDHGSKSATVEASQHSDSSTSNRNDMASSSVVSKSAIPAWQMAALNRSGGSNNVPVQP